MSDLIFISGKVIIECLTGSNTWSILCEGPNLVLNAGKLNTEHLIGGHPAGKQMDKIGVGTGGVAVSPADVALTSPIIKNIETVEYLPGYILSFVATLQGSDPAMTIREVGLYNQDNVLCHRKVFDPPKEKVSGLSYRITYQVKVK